MNTIKIRPVNFALTLIISALFLFIAATAFAANSRPAVGPVAPSYGSSPVDTPVEFTATYSDPDGWQNIKLALIQIDTRTKDTNHSYIQYNQNTNRIYLKNDANTAYIGGYAPGSSHIIENSYIKLDCSKTTVSGSGTTMTVKWNITFKPSFENIQVKNIYLYARDDLNLNKGWVQKGTWLVGPNSAPQVGTVAPSNASVATSTLVFFTTTYTDPNGWQDIQNAQFLVNSTTKCGKCLMVAYNQNNGKLYLRNDENSRFVGNARPGTDNILENSYAQLDCSKTTVSGSGNTLTIKWAVKFKPKFTGAKNSYLYVSDDSKALQTWTKKGTCSIYLSDPDQIVVRSGDRLILENSQKPFYFSSTNQYYLFYKPLPMIDEVFDDAAAMSINAIRTWGFCDGMYKEGVSFQPEAGVYSETGFARMDYLIKKARDCNMRLIIPLVNNWNDFGGMLAYVNWSPTASTHDEFYTDVYCKQLYKDYVEYFLNRTNTLTGIKYKDDPTILIWELANEPNCQSDTTGDTLQAWIDEMAEFIKSIDSKHLVSTGGEGWYTATSKIGYHNKGVDYIRNNQSPYIDICSFHLFYGQYGLSIPDGHLQWIEEHCNDAHFTINKPVYCGEIGVSVSRGTSTEAEQMARRNSFYSDWFGAFLNRVADGAGFWLLSADSYHDYDHYTVYYPGDAQTCAIISNFSDNMAERRNLDYFLPMISLENKRIDEQQTLEFQITISNPSNLSLTFSSQNLPEGATIDNNGYFYWGSTEAGIYNNIEVAVSYGATVVASGTFNITVIDVNGDNAPQIASIPDVVMDKNTILNHAIDLWRITTDDETPVEDIIFSVSLLYGSGVSATMEDNRYINIIPAQDFFGYVYFDIRAIDERSLSDTQSFLVIVKNDGIIRVPADYPTITEAIAHTNSGDAILVAPGTYNEGELYLKAYTSLTSEGGPSNTIIDATDKSYGVGTSGNSVVVQGFTIKNANGDGIINATAVNNMIENNNGDGITFPIWGSGIDIDIINNTIRNNNGDGVHVAWVKGAAVDIMNNTIKNNSRGGIWICEAANIINNVIENNNNGGIAAGMWTGYSSPDGTTIYNNIVKNNGQHVEIYTELTQNSKIFNNTIIKDAGYTGTAIYINWGSSSLLENNIIVGNSSNSSPAILGWNSQVSIAYNDIWNYFTSWGSDSMKLDPQFVDAANGDYHLLPTSPCIDAGDPDVQYNDTNGSRNDMGVYGGPNSL
ncbi:MAG: right-handed parallel beta-helix repeat-containing protein [Candidatus Omnitrophica bacterium]|nr:right-handed parallel beta-helix repeat-containing protein [Candidatus Omnitrophota bacterium]